jgi:hypothetical protein
MPKIFPLPPALSISSLAIFAPRPDVVAAELRRVCRSGGAGHR